MTDNTPMVPTDAEIIALMGDPRYSTIGAVREAISRWGQLYTTPQPAQAQAIQGVQWQCGPQASGFTPPQPTQAQAGPISGAKSFQTYAEANAYSRGYYAGKKAATQAQAQAGAVPLTDEQIDSLLWKYGSDPDDEHMAAMLKEAHGIKAKEAGNAE